jgi:hypothetical protein
MRKMPRYPIYVPTKGRYQRAHSKTINRLTRDQVPFIAVCEKEEAEQYQRLCDDAGELLVLPESGKGVSWARNVIWEDSIKRGAERHWQLDDNIVEFRRLYRGERIPASSAISLATCEEFTDRYENIAISGLAYQMFVTRRTNAPFYLNCHVYSCTLLNNAIPNRFRLGYNEDTDICLQVLTEGWCTVLINVFMATKLPTMTVPGGHNDEEDPFNYKADGRLKMAKTLERMWPHIVTVDRRWGRPQHVVRDNWKQFDTQLIPKADFDITALPDVDEFGMKLHELTPTDNPRLRKLVDGFEGEQLKL